MRCPEVSVAGLIWRCTDNLDPPVLNKILLKIRTAGDADQYGMKKLYFFLLLLYAYGAKGQFLPSVLESNPLSVDWKQVKSPHFRVLFQEGGDSLAQSTINALEALYHPATASLTSKPGKIAIALQQKSSISNGFVTVGPRRAEFYAMPPQNYNFLGTNRWMDLLSAHEFRHVAQFEKSRRGWNKIVYYLFGEDAYGALAHLAMPEWFWEGDAVNVETSLTHSGRGRIPEFNIGFRARLLEEGPFSYDKQYLGSFKHFIPNHYVTGHYMTAHLRRKYGMDIWDKVAERAFYAPFLPWRTPYALKRETGKNIRQNYQAMIDEMDSLWSSRLVDITITEAKTVNQRKNQVYTSYRFPQIADDGAVIALKSGLGSIQQFVSIDSLGKEKVVFTPGTVNDAGMLSVQGDKLAYVEYGYNPRWRAVTYSEIRIVDLAEEKSHSLTRRSRYSAASLSPDQRMVATVYTNEKSYSYLVVLDAITGNELKRFPNPDNDFYQMPRWSDDGLSIAVVKQRDQKKALSLFDYPSGVERMVAPFAYENYGHPLKYGDYVFYNSPYNGIDNIYALRLESGIHYQVTSRKYGAFNPEIHNDVLYFNDYTIDGYDVVTAPLEPERWTPKAKTTDRNDYYYQPLAEQENNEDILLEADQTVYPVSNYNKLSGMINPYSWGIYSNTNADNFLIGVVSQDILSSTAISAGYRIDADGFSGGWFGKLSYQGFFPIIDLTYELLKDPIFNDRVLTGAMRVPLILTHSKYHENLNAGIGVSLGKMTNISGDESYVASAIYRNVSYSLEYSRLLKQSQRDVRSRWGQFIFAQYDHMPFGGDVSSAQLALQGGLFFPGLFKHHSLRIGGRYQVYSSFPSFFGNKITSPRGYPRLFEKEYVGGSVDYAFPLFYPDFNIASVVNIQRVKANLFYDAGAGMDEDIYDYYNSLGADLTADINILRLRPLFEIGLRFAYVPENRASEVRLLVGSFPFQ